MKIKIQKIDFIKDASLIQSAFSIRKKVFVEEQAVPEQDELDEFEPDSIHFLAIDEGNPCGTARWRYSGPEKIKLERFAVLPEFRGKGIGEALVLAVLADIPKTGQVYLHAQIQVVPFYEKLGFQAQGPEFDECGILHRTMFFNKKQI